MTDTLTVAGLIATTPRHLVTSEGLSITSFRLASTERRYDRVTGSWKDDATNWYTVVAFRDLADNIMASLDKGQRIVVTGSLRIREWESGDRSGVNVEIEAEHIGHDLAFGTTTFIRNVAALA